MMPKTCPSCYQLTWDMAARSTSLHITNLVHSDGWYSLQFIRRTKVHMYSQPYEITLQKVNARCQPKTSTSTLPSKLRTQLAINAFAPPGDHFGTSLHLNRQQTFNVSREDTLRATLHPPSSGNATRVYVLV